MKEKYSFLECHGILKHLWTRCGSVWPSSQPKRSIPRMGIQAGLRSRETHNEDKQPLHMGVCTIAFCIIKWADSAIFSDRQTKLNNNLKACRDEKLKLTSCVNFSRESCVGNLNVCQEERERKGCKPNYAPMVAHQKWQLARRGLTIKFPVKLLPRRDSLLPKATPNPLSKVIPNLIVHNLEWRNVCVRLINWKIT